MLNRRQFRRFSFNEPVGYQKEKDYPMEGSLAEDISQSGLKLSVNEFVALNTVLELQIQLPGRIQLIPARAKVVWVQEMPFRDDVWEIGLELIPDSFSSSAIRNYVSLRGTENM